MSRIIVEGEITKTLPGGTFIIELTTKDKHQVTASVSGKMRIHYIKLVTGDSVEVELSPYDLDRGRIVKRL